MGVYVKKMKIPKCCAECPLNHDAECYMYNRLVCEEPYTQRADWCPLVEIKPHGRLIDADELSDRLVALSDCEWNQTVGTSWSNAYEEVNGFVEDAQTIIEAEDGT